MAANGTHKTDQPTPGQRLRRLLDDRSSIVVAPGVYDGFSARIALELGFQCIYMVSSPFDSKLPKLSNTITRQVLGLVLRNLVSLTLDLLH